MDKSSGDTNYEITKRDEVMNSPKCLLPDFRYLYFKDN